ncbi:MAG: NADP oxidoreductase [Bacteroidetes bacterium]|nr:MAG: NADP oxidoreductase [Bacteroidota bacterium]
MTTSKTIAIIGASGSMGTAISSSLAKTGNYSLLLMSDQTESLPELKSSLEQYHSNTQVHIIDCAKEASWEADIIILATPFQAEKDLAEKIREVATGKIVISIANPLNSTFDGFVTTPDTSAAEELQKLLPNSTVIKAFNTTFAADFAHTVIDGKQVDSFIAGDQETALNTVAELVAGVGFNPIIAGDLKVSRTLENMQLLMIQLGMKYNYNWLAGWKILHN